VQSRPQTHYFFLLFRCLSFIFPLALFHDQNQSSSFFRDCILTASSLPTVFFTQAMDSAGTGSASGSGSAASASAPRAAPALAPTLDQKVKAEVEEKLFSSLPAFDPAYTVSRSPYVTPASILIACARSAPPSHKPLTGKAAAAEEKRVAELTAKLTAEAEAANARLASAPCTLVTPKEEFTETDVISLSLSYDYIARNDPNKMFGHTPDEEEEGDAATASASAAATAPAPAASTSTTPIPAASTSSAASAFASASAAPPSAPALVRAESEVKAPAPEGPPTPLDLSRAYAAIDERTHLRLIRKNTELKAAAASANADGKTKGKKAADSKQAAADAGKDQKSAAKEDVKQNSETLNSSGDLPKTCFPVVKRV
jgi:hypothetical protein